MPPITINDPDSVVRVETLVSGGSAAFSGTTSFGFWIMGASGLSLDTVATNMETALLAFYGSGANGVLERMASTASIIGTRYGKPLVDPPPVPHEETRSLAGTGNSSLMPPDIAMVISWRSDTSGPAFRSRSYLAALSTQCNASTGLLDASQCTDMASVANTFIAAMDAIDLPLVAVSRYHVVGGVVTERATPLGAAILSASVDVHPDTQRRRGAA